jgi:hypothetical protein
LSTPESEDFEEVPMDSLGALDHFDPFLWIGNRGSKIETVPVGPKSNIETILWDLQSQAGTIPVGPRLN